MPKVLALGEWKLEDQLKISLGHMKPCHKSTVCERDPEDAE